MPDTWDKDMIMCDSCEKWFHFKCILIQKCPANKNSGFVVTVHVSLQHSS